jgi:hypothetical protein
MLHPDHAICFRVHHQDAVAKIGTGLDIMPFARRNLFALFWGRKPNEICLLGVWRGLAG